MPTVVRFDCFEVDLAAGQLLKRGAKVHLREQCFQILAALVTRPGEVVTRQELRQRLWPDQVFVDFDANLNTAIARLREVLNDLAERPRFIETLPRHGYRFIAAVSKPAPEEGAPARNPRLLVLPFVNSSGDPNQEYFSDAMTEEVISAVAAIASEQLAVIARTTSMRYKRTRKDIAHIGRELTVDYVVEGGVRRAGDRLSISVQLVKAADQTHLFARKYGARMPGVFSLHRRIARDITKHVPGISDGRGAALRVDVRNKPAQDLAAYNEYIKGRYEMWKMTAEGTSEAKRHFEAALAREPRFAPACKALAELHFYLSAWGYMPSREMDAAGRSYALRAMEIDSRSAEAHVLMSFYPSRRTGGAEVDHYDWAQVQNEVARARELDAASRVVRLRHAMVQAILGRPDEAAAELERALDSDPLSLDIRGWLAIMLHLGRHYDRALEHVARLQELEPDHFLPYYLFGYIYLGMQRFDESARAFRKVIELSGELPLMLGLQALSLGLGGRRAEARALLDRLSELARQRYVAPTSFAWAHLGLGNVDEAFVWMERAVDAPDRMMEAIKTYPFLDPLRSDPRFAALLRRMNLEP